MVSSYNAPIQDMEKKGCAPAWLDRNPHEVAPTWMAAIVGDEESSSRWTKNTLQHVV